MASTVGHTLAGIAIHNALSYEGQFGPIQKSWKQLLPFLILPNLPDADFLISLILYDNANAFHNEITHTLLFVLIVSILLTPFRFFGPPLRTFIIALSLIGSHLFLDISAGEPLSGLKGVGVRLLYPFYDNHISSPVILFWGPHHQTLKDLISIHNLIGIMWELLFFIPLIKFIKGLSARSFRQEVGKR